MFKPDATHAPALLHTLRHGDWPRRCCTRSGTRADFESSLAQSASYYAAVAVRPDLAHYCMSDKHRAPIALCAVLLAKWILVGFAATRACCTLWTIGASMRSIRLHAPRRKPHSIPIGSRFVFSVELCYPMLRFVQLRLFASTCHLMVCFTASSSAFCDFVCSIARITSCSADKQDSVAFLMLCMIYFIYHDVSYLFIGLFLSILFIVFIVFIWFIDVFSLLCVLFILITAPNSSHSTTIFRMIYICDDFEFGNSKKAGGRFAAGPVFFSKSWKVHIFTTFFASFLEAGKFHRNKAKALYDIGYISFSHSLRPSARRISVLNGCRENPWPGSGGAFLMNSSYGPCVITYFFMFCIFWIFTFPDN